MIDIVVNMIIQWLESDVGAPSLERVLWCDPCGESVVVIDVEDPKTLPTTRTRAEIESALAQKTALRHAIDPYASLASLPSGSSAKHLELRDRAWEKICRLVVQQPEIYFSDYRKRLIMNDPAASQGPLDNIYKYLRRYWKRGMIKNALLPDYGKCGAPGKERAVRDGNKLGRKPKIVMADPARIGVNVDDVMKHIFDIAIRQYFNTSEEYPLRSTYNQMIENHFNLGYREQGGIRIPIMPLAHQVPSFGQFAYWYNKHKNLVHSIVSRKGRRAYELRYRPLLGNSTQMAFGPGSIYQIDSTVADIYLVCTYDRSRIIGRPVVYFCIDIFSRLCVGLYVGLEGPSWLTGMMALANSTIDKVSFCAEFGIRIADEDWPCRFLPEQITADRGEFIGILSDNLVDNLNITFANCPPYRGDLKGIVERSFRRANDTFIKWLPGAIRKRDHGDPDYRLEAKLTTHEFTKILILMTIEYNLFHRIENYPLDREMMEDSVEPVPIELWDWGIVHRTGHLREKSQDIIKLALLPRAKATVTFRGIQCNGMLYSCERAIREQWFVKARHSGRWHLDASYDPRKTQIIYLHLGNGCIESCQLLPHEERFKDLRVEEVLEFQELQKQRAALHKSRRMQSSAEFNAFNKSTIDTAIELTDAALKHSTPNRNRTHDIRLNREEAKEIIRNDEGWDLRSDLQPGLQKRGEVMTFPEGEKGLNEEPVSAATAKKRFLEAIERSERRDDNE